MARTYSYTVSAATGLSTAKDSLVAAIEGLVVISTAVTEASDNLPEAFELNQNYPNPFNPSTVIGYKLSAVSSVTLKVYDALGREVAALVEARQNAGYHQITFNASKLSSGVYFYRITAGTFTDVKKLVLVK
ncbi:MAG: hypothetical protein B7Z63_04735 [Ignavibacteriae bacterium 37-53-5]|nr:MAG: hypothetical protein B7Z63_04735 [Ignavibacteriae bacterium 37-53-5]